MRRMTDRTFRQCTMAAALALGIAVMAGILAPAVHAGEVPFGDRVSPAISYYNRTTPHVSTGGLLGEGAPAELRQLGYRTVIDLRTPKEGTAAEKAAVEAAGLAYINIPIARGAPTPEQIAVFAAAISSAANHPVHVHCVSANRVGAMWALYLAAQGVPPEYAVSEGKTVGLRGKREAGVRAVLGLPAN